MNQEYFALWYRLDDEEGFLLWYSGEQDGVVTSRNDEVPSFSDLSSLKEFAVSIGISTSKETPVLHDLDIVKCWLESPNRYAIDPSEFLSAWNLFFDIANSIGRVLESNETKDIYEKLFLANNLPSIADPERPFVPAWSDRECEILSKVLNQGLEVFRATTVGLA